MGGGWGGHLVGLEDWVRRISRRAGWVEENTAGVVKMVVHWIFSNYMKRFREILREDPRGFL